MHGKEDTFVAFDLVKETGEYFKNFIPFETRGHHLPIEIPAEYQKNVIKFLEE